MIAEEPLSALKSIKKQIVGSTGEWKAFGGEGNFLEQLSI